MNNFLSLAAVFAAMVISSLAYAQSSQRSVVIGTMTTTPNAILALNPPGSDQGFLMPQLTTSDRNEMRPSSPDEDGLLVFDINEKEFYYWKDDHWVKSWSAAEPVEPTVQYSSIDPADFSGLRNANKQDRTNALIFDDNTTFVTVYKRDEGSYVIAPIHLPDGAQIQQIQFYYMDRDAQNISLNIYRRSFMGGNENIVPSWNSTGSSSTVQTSTLMPIPAKGLIDNSQYSYRVVVDLNPTSDANTSGDATHRVYGLKIKYVK